jgi:hypothetical protein
MLHRSVLEEALQVSRLGDIDSTIITLLDTKAKERQNVTLVICNLVIETLQTGSQFVDKNTFFGSVLKV